MRVSPLRNPREPAEDAFCRERVRRPRALRLLVPGTLNPSEPISQPDLSWIREPES